MSRHLARVSDMTQWWSSTKPHHGHGYGDEICQSEFITAVLDPGQPLTNPRHRCYSRPSAPMRPNRVSSRRLPIGATSLTRRSSASVGKWLSLSITYPTCR